MDFNFNFPGRYRESSFLSVEGMIVEMEPSGNGTRRADACRLFVTVEDTNGNIVNFIVTPSTYVADYTQLHEGMNCTFFYRADAPVPLIYPPQYTAAVVAPQKVGQFVSVGYFNSSLLNEDQTLKLNIDRRVEIVTVNNQIFLGNPANHYLVVMYSTTTRSIPAQTTPDKIVVLCDI